MSTSDNVGETVQYEEVLTEESEASGSDVAGEADLVPLTAQQEADLLAEEEGNEPGEISQGHAGGGSELSESDSEGCGHVEE